MSTQQNQTGNDQGPKKFKRGEFIFKEGDKADHIYLVQSGRVAICVVRPSSRIEIFVATKGAILGEQALYGMSKHVLSAEALNDVVVLEVPLTIAKPQVDSTNGFLKTLLKSMADELKFSFNELKSIKLEKEAVACPDIYVPRVFACINLVTRHLGKKLENGDWEIAWNSMKIFGVRMFLEAPQRLQSTLELLTKLKYAEMVFEKNEEGETELSRIIIKNLQLVEDFGEFFQYNLFKGGVAEILKYDEIACNVAKIMVKATEGTETDRYGSVRILFDQLAELLKEETGVPLKNTHIDLLEKKGLFMKRTANDKEVWLSFDRKEYNQTSQFWSIIHEIDKWNATGRVNMNEEIKKKPKAGGPVCPECDSAIPADAKFCSECGFKLKAA